MRNILIFMNKYLWEWLAFIVTFLLLSVGYAKIRNYNEPEVTKFKIKNIPDKEFFVEFRNRYITRGYYMDDFGKVEKVEINNAVVIPINENPVD